MESEKTGHVPCGYGRLGLCCSDCLLGPCRLAPFDEGPSKGLCGDDRDRMVARHLLRLSVCEASHAVQQLAKTVLRTHTMTPEPQIVGEAKALLSLVPQNAGSLVSFLYPEKVFPSVQRVFQRTEFPPKSLIRILFDSLAVEEKEASGIDEILIQSLQISLVRLISEALEQDLTRILHRGEGQRDAEHREVQEALDCLSSPGPFIILLSEDDLSSAQPLNRIRNGLLQKLDGKAPIFPVKKALALPDFGRRVFERWGLSTTDSGSLVLISSRRVTSVLGALALGYTVFSSPPLPVHGSARTEKFFCADLKRILGNSYRPSWDEGAMVEALKQLTGPI